MKFKVGDIVISNGRHNYSVTDETAILKVVESKSSGRIYVKVIKTLEGNPYYRLEDKLPIYSLESTNFKLYGVPNNPLSKAVYPNYIESQYGQYLIPKEYNE